VLPGKPLLLLIVDNHTKMRYPVKRAQIAEDLL